MVNALTVIPRMQVSEHGLILKCFSSSLDEDVPIIQGFSDDEPLVTA